MDLNSVLSSHIQSKVCCTFPLLLQDIPLPSPSGSSSALSSAQPDAETPSYVPVSLNVSGEAETEVDLAQSSDNTSFPVFPVNTSGICGPVLRSISVFYVTAVC